MQSPETIDSYKEWYVAGNSKGELVAICTDPVRQKMEAQL
mgnify:CR=1 FL=1